MSFLRSDVLANIILLLDNKDLYAHNILFYTQVVKLMIKKEILKTIESQAISCFPFQNKQWSSQVLDVAQLM